MSLIPHGMSFSPHGMSFIPCGTSFIPCGTSFIPNRMSLIPRGMSFIPSGMSFIPRGMSFIPHSMSFIPRGMSLIPRGISFIPSVKDAVDKKMPDFSYRKAGHHTLHDGWTRELPISWVEIVLTARAPAYYARMPPTLLERPARIAVLSALSASGALVACASEPPPRAVEPVSVVVPPPTAEPIASAPPTPPPAPPPVELPPEIPRPSPGGCALSTKIWRQSTPLRLGPKGPSFAQVERGQARLVLPAGDPAQGAYLETDQEGVTLRGIVLPDTFVLHPTHPLTVARMVVVLDGGARLRWSGGGGNRVVTRFEPFPMPLGFDFSTHDKPAGQVEYGLVGVQEATVELGCEEVALDRGSYDLRQPPGLPSTTKNGWLLRDRDIPVSALPDGAPSAVLRLHPRRDNGPLDDQVEILESRGKSTRILYRRSDALVIGWVATDALKLGKHPRMLREAAEFGMIGLLNGAPEEPAPPPPPKVTCPADLALVAEHEGVRATVGAIHAGTPLLPGSADGAFTHVDLASPGGIKLEKGTALLVRSSDLAACSPVK